MPGQLLLMILFSLSGLLIIVLSLPLVFRKVPPNSFYGLRVPATLKDEWVWYEANAKAGRDLIGFGVLFILAALGLGVAPLAEATYAGALAGFSMAGGLTVVVIGLRRANRLLRQRRGS
jgi:uncharacterized membrane protein